MKHSARVFLRRRWRGYYRGDDERLTSV